MSDKFAELDAIIIGAASNEWQKTALLISKVFDVLKEQGKELPAQTIAERIYALIEEKFLTSTGNIRRWRDSNVKLTG